MSDTGQLGDRLRRELIRVSIVRRAVTCVSEIGPCGNPIE